jgi:hypothetical protein
MLVQVDQLGCASDPAEGSFLYRLRWANKGYDGPVVIQVDVLVQDANIGDVRNRLSNGFYNIRAACFRKIWNAFYERRGHKGAFPGR